MSRREMKEIAFKPTRFNSFMLRLTFMLIPGGFIMTMAECLAITFEHAAPLWLRIFSIPAAFIWAYGGYVTIRVFWSRGEEVELKEIKDEEDEEEMENSSLYDAADDYTDHSSRRGD